MKKRIHYNISEILGKSLTDFNNDIIEISNFPPVIEDMLLSFLKQEYGEYIFLDRERLNFVEQRLNNVEKRLKRAKRRREKMPKDKKRIDFGEEVVEEAKKLLYSVSKSKIEKGIFDIKEVLRLNKQAKTLYNIVVECLRDEFSSDKERFKRVIKKIHDALKEKMI